MAERQQKSETQPQVQTRTLAHPVLLESPVGRPLAPERIEKFRKVYKRVRSRLVDSSFVEVVGSQGLDGE